MVYCGSHPEAGDMSYKEIKQHDKMWHHECIHCGLEQVKNYVAPYGYCDVCKHKLYIHAPSDLAKCLKKMEQRDNRDWAKTEKLANKIRASARRHGIKAAWAQQKGRK